MGEPEARIRYDQDPTTGCPRSGELRAPQHVILKPALTLSRWIRPSGVNIQLNLTVMEASDEVVAGCESGADPYHNQALINYSSNDSRRLSARESAQALQRGVFGCIEVGQPRDTESYIKRCETSGSWLPA